MMFEIPPYPFDFEFARPWLFWLFLLLPLIALYQLWPQRRLIGAFQFTQIKTLLKGGRGWRTYFQGVPVILQVLAMALLIIALAGPRTSTKTEIEEEGIDIFLVLDMSGSMEAYDLEIVDIRRMLAQGEKPKNRFNVAREVFRDFVQTRKNDRIGMVIFGKDAFLEFPLTLDRETILNILDERKMEDIDGSGTAIGDAVARAVAGMRNSSAKSKAIILVTDGDRRGGSISPRTASSLAREKDVNVFPILVGRPGLLPIVPNDADWLSHRSVDFMVNPRLLKEIAETTEGKFYNSSDKEALDADLRDILDQFEKTRNKSESFYSFTEYFTPYAQLALLLLAFAAVLKYAVIRKFP